MLQDVQPGMDLHVSLHSVFQFKKKSSAMDFPGLNSDPTGFMLWPPDLIILVLFLRNYILSASLASHVTQKYCNTHEPLSPFAVEKKAVKGNSKVFIDAFESKMWNHAAMISELIQNVSQFKFLLIYDADSVAFTCR